MPAYYVLTGPTAAGKTSMLTGFAEAVPLTVISADSQQVYRHMDIGTAKPDQHTLSRLPHCGIDLVTPDRQFNAFDFLKAAAQCLAEAEKQGRQVWVSGGTGLYLQALLNGLTLGLAPRPRLRAALATMLAGESPRELAGRLELQLVDPDNPVRVVRAAELACSTERTTQEIYAAAGLGAPQLAADNGEADNEPPPTELARWSCGGIAVLDPGKGPLLAAIEARTLQMYTAGLIDEVAELRRLGYGDCEVVRKGIGYREAGAVLDGALVYKEALEQTVIRTRQYAKRQRTFFRGAGWPVLDTVAAKAWVSTVLQSTQP